MQLAEAAGTYPNLCDSPLTLQRSCWREEEEEEVVVHQELDRALARLHAGWGEGRRLTPGAHHHVTADGLDEPEGERCGGSGEGGSQQLCFHYSALQNKSHNILSKSVVIGRSLS